MDTNDAAALADQDGDGARTYQEWVAWTEPNNALEVFQITSVTMLSSTSAVFRWSSKPGKTYALFSSTNLPPQPLTQLVTGIPGTPPENVFTNGFVAEGVQYFWAEVSE